MNVLVLVNDKTPRRPQKIRDSIFTKGAIRGKAGGTGLGTKIVKDVVDTHSGTIPVDSEQGKGTTFTIHIPINPQTDKLAE